MPDADGNLTREEALALNDSVGAEDIIFAEEHGEDALHEKYIQEQNQRIVNQAKKTQEDK